MDSLVYAGSLCSSKGESSMPVKKRTGNVKKTLASGATATRALGPPSVKLEVGVEGERKA